VRERAVSWRIHANARLFRLPQLFQALRISSTAISPWRFSMIRSIFVLGALFFSAHAHSASIVSMEEETDLSPCNALRSSSLQSIQQGLRTYSQLQESFFDNTSRLRSLSNGASVQEAGASGQRAAYCAAARTSLAGFHSKGLELIPAMEKSQAAVAFLYSEQSHGICRLAISNANKAVKRNSEFTRRSQAELQTLCPGMPALSSGSSPRT
jgi:hypothetical protein